MKRKKILVFADWYLPGYKAGGPIRSVANLVELLKADYDFDVITRNTDFGESIPYQNIESDQWLDQGDGVRIWYCSAGRDGKADMKRLLNETEAEHVYLNSFFSKKFALTPLSLARKMGKKVVLAPRGMLGQGALGIKSTKKKVFIRAAKAIGLYKGITWHASTKSEENEIRAVFGASANVKIAKNLTLLPQDDGELKPKAENSARFLYLSRVAGIKHTDFAIRMVAEFPEQATLDIYGPADEPEYWKTCEALIADHKNIAYHGQLSYDQVSPVMREYDFFILPTENENYGHVIIEALGSGLPVIISDRTPWRDLSGKGIGWDLPFLDEAEFRKTLESAIKMPPDQHLEMKRAARAFGQHVMCHPDDVQANRILFT